MLCFGSITYELVHRSPMPVLVVPDTSAEDCIGSFEFRLTTHNCCLAPDPARSSRVPRALPTRRFALRSSEPPTPTITHRTKRPNDAAAAGPTSAERHLVADPARATMDRGLLPGQALPTSGERGVQHEGDAPHPRRGVRAARGSGARDRVRHWTQPSAPAALGRPPSGGRPTAARPRPRWCAPSRESRDSRFRRSGRPVPGA